MTYAFETAKRLELSVPFDRAGNILIGCNPRLHTISALGVYLCGQIVHVRVENGREIQVRDVLEEETHQYAFAEPVGELGFYRHSFIAWSLDSDAEVLNPGIVRTFTDRLASYTVALVEERAVDFACDRH